MTETTQTTLPQVDLVPPVQPVKKTRKPRVRDEAKTKTGLTSAISFRMSPLDIVRLDEACRESDLDRTRYVRSLISNLVIRTRMPKMDKDSLAQLIRIGTNLNQIAAANNMALINNSFDTALLNKTLIAVKDTQDLLAVFTKDLVKPSEGST